ncbi:hypothetical protein FS842_002063 [Serendipita sp. 407]|nr:hypothetical protein FS842_002063 [Serendipita sp. 407]
MSTPIPAFNPTSSFSSSTSSTPGMEELDLPSIYDHQRKYIATLTKQLPEEGSQQMATSFTLRKDVSISSVSTVSISSHSNTTGTQLVTLNAPTTIKLELEAQGPFRFQPAPAPSPEPEWDELASDIIYLKLASTDGKRSSAGATAAGTILIAYADGRVDVCLDLVKVEAVWCRPGAPHSSPVTLALETINLNFLSYFRPAPPPQQARPSPSSLQPLLTSAPLHPRFLASNHPVLMRDAVYGDSVYVTHNFGVHAIWLGWMSDVRRALERKDATEDFKSLQDLLDDLLEQDEGLSHVVQLLDTVDPAMRITFPVVGCAVSSDVFVDYSLLAFTSHHQAVGMELNVRVPEPQANEIGIMAEAAPHLRALRKSSDALNNNTTLVQSTDKNQPSGQSASSPPPAYAAYNAAPFVGVTPYRPPPLPPVPSVIVGKTEADPTQLRQFATAVATMAEYHRSLGVTAGVLEERVFLLTKERDRQMAVTMTLKNRVDKLVGRDSVAGQRQATLAKFNRISAIQPTLLKRIDWVLQRLMDTYNGALTEKEKAYFEELKRMRKQILPTADGNSLLSKADMLSKQLELLMPTVKDINEKEKAMKEGQIQSNKLGTKQMLDIGRKLGSEDIQIKETVSKIQTLASRMGLATAGLPDETASD